MTEEHSPVQGPGSEWLLTCRFPALWEKYPESITEPRRGAVGVTRKGSCKNVMRGLHLKGEWRDWHSQNRGEGKSRTRPEKATEGSEGRKAGRGQTEGGGDSQHGRGQVGAPTWPHRGGSYGNAWGRATTTRTRMVRSEDEAWRLRWVRKQLGWRLLEHYFP